MPHAEAQDGPGETLDDLFAYDDSLDDVFNAQIPSNLTSAKDREANASARRDLGIDDEVVLARKRKLIAKLDEQRLLSSHGITKLRHTAKTKLKFKGKGHEYSDMQNMLSMYQLWLDDLYPRAKFADGLTIIEKLGHTKHLHMRRKAWIDEGRPKRADSPDDDVAEVGGSGEHAVESLSSDDDDPFSVPVMASRSVGDATDQQAPKGNVDSAVDAAQPDEDELDALLAENPQPDESRGHSIFGTGQPSQSLPRDRGREEDDAFAAEMEAMQEMEGAW